MADVFKKLSSVTYDYSRNAFSAPDKGLHPLFFPKVVAVIGATERVNSVGRTTMENLISGNKGNFELYPINPKSETILGVTAYKSIGEVPEEVDTAVVILPAHTVLAVTEQCGIAGVKSLIIISAGFKEIGPEGAKMEDDIIAMAKKYSMRVVGPNCLGLMMPNYGYNATFAARMSLEGSLAFISQSGAMCTAALDWAVQQKVGFSSFLSIGSMADVEWSDIIEYLGEDPSTSAILIYMETIGNARAFLSACKQVTPRKPIVVIKAGKSDAAAKAAASHTGSLAGSHDSYLAAMRRCGVLCVDSIRELFDVANVIDKQPRPLGNKLTIITNAGGPGVLATDATATNGGEIAPLSPETIAELNKFLPSAWSHDNPVDVLGDANAECYAKTLSVCLEDTNSDGILIVLSPQSVTEPLKTANAVIEAVKDLKARGKCTKPIICSWMGGMDVEEAFIHLNGNGIPCISSPDDAAKTFCQLYEQYRYTLNAAVPALDIYDNQTAAPTVGDNGVKAMAILKKAYEAEQEILSEYDSKIVMKSFGIPIAESIIATTVEEATDATKLTGFPCVAKLHSDTITHKSDVGGVVLNLNSAESVAKAFVTIKDNCLKHTGSLDGFQGINVQPMLDIASGIELLAGSVVDPQFGPLVVFGAGGCMVEIYQDTCTAIPPLTRQAAKDAIDATKISKALYGTGNARFPGVDMTSLQDSLIAFSNLVSRVGEYVAEIEINPLLALKDRMVALDARVVMRPKNSEVPVMLPIIRPYPSEHQSFAEGYHLRILKPSDSNAWMEFIHGCSHGAIRKRFLNTETIGSLEKKIQSFLDCDYDNVLPFAAFDASGNIDIVIRVSKLRQEHSIAQMSFLKNERFRIDAMDSLLDFVFEVCRVESIDSLRAVVNTDDMAALKEIGWSEFEPIEADLFKANYDLNKTAKL